MLRNLLLSIQQDVTNVLQICRVFFLFFWICERRSSTSFVCITQILGTQPTTVRPPSPLTLPHLLSSAYPLCLLLTKAKIIQALRLANSHAHFEADNVDRLISYELSSVSVSVSASVPASVSASFSSSSAVASV